MKFKCIRGVVTSAGPVSIGQVVELPDYEAKVLMSQGKFVPHDEVEVKAAAAPTYEKRIPAPAKGRRGRKG